MEPEALSCEDKGIHIGSITRAGELTGAPEIDEIYRVYKNRTSHNQADKEGDN